MIFRSYLLFLLMTFVKSFTPSCKTCKFFVPNVINDSLGQCTMFQDAVYHDNQQATLQKNLAIHCRNDENLCGKSGYLYEPIDNEEFDKKFENYQYIRRLCADDFIEETNLEELEKIEKNLVDVFQKMRRHNIKVIYNTPNAISKLIKKLKE